MNPTISGIHHVTAITADAQKNLDFYTGVLGLRLVKLTVNFDDPGSYHLYYGDELGRPGTIMTFLAWPAIRGFHGVTLSEEGYENTARLLTDVLGFRADGSEGNRFRYRAAGGG